MEKKSKVPLNVGLLAHVDAGKTTLSEAMLYCGGILRQQGRVDHGTAYLDTDAMERERGITIFSKQAVLPLGQFELTLLDTPGHVDFSGEMERTLQVIDYAILVISATDGVQSHTLTVWKLLEQYHIPTFLFINKMDLANADKNAVLQDLHKSLSGACLDFTREDETLLEAIALQDEQLAEQYLENGTLTVQEIAGAVAQRKVFPCLFGAALKTQGVQQLLDLFERFARSPQYPAEFGARVYKIARDPQGARLTYLKVTGGTLKVKDVLKGTDENGRQWQEKIDQIRIYSGARFSAAEQVSAGTVCAVTGLSKTCLGQGLGREKAARPAALQPVMSCEVRLPEGCDVHRAVQDFRQLEEEEPQLHIVWDERLQVIRLQMMGEVQLDVIKRMVWERFGLSVGFAPGKIVYKETIQSPVVGIGHFEPLRHYAEVHLLMQPLARGSGLQLEAACSEDMLDKNWQRLILTHLAERTHVGVLTGSPITDMKITLIAGRAHVKHTEGGDFRQATYRAVRQGLMQAQSILLEPWYSFRIEVPPEQIGRVISDVQRMGGSFDPPHNTPQTAVLEGRAPVSEMRGYPAILTGFSRGKGKISCTLSGYEPCHETAAVVDAADYDAQHDTENPADSVFCAHGSGFIVPWPLVPEYAHVQSAIAHPPQEEDKAGAFKPIRPAAPPDARTQDSLAQEAELAAIFERTYGPAKRRELFRTVPTPQKEYVYEPSGPEYLLVDGYNIIFAWDELRELGRENMDAARTALADILCNYQGFRKCQVILVFDAYKVKHGAGDVAKYNNIFIVYTKEAETADMYIEKTTYQLAKKRRVRVVTSDGAEQMIILGHGAMRVSASMFHEEVEQATREIRALIEESNRRNDRLMKSK